MLHTATNVRSEGSESGSHPAPPRHYVPDIDIASPPPSNQALMRAAGSAQPPLRPSRVPVLQKKCICGGTCTSCKDDAAKLQTKLAINEPGDAHEQEADRVADQVMRPPQAKLHRKTTANRTGQDSSHDRAPESKIPPIVHEVLRSPGAPLDAPTRTLFERRFGSNLSAVRVHTNDAAAMSARAVKARAYAVNHHIVFGAGQFSPGTRAGQWLIAHELAHTLQQQGASPSDNIAVGDLGDPLEQEADRAAQRAAFGFSSRIGKSSQRRLSRTPESWYRGEVEGLPAAEPGEWFHDLGDGMYLSDRPNVAAVFSTREGATSSTTRLWVAQIERSALGRVLDLTRDPAWAAYLAEMHPGGQTTRELMSMGAEQYWGFFSEFLNQRGLVLENYDTIIGPELLHGGDEMCIRTASIQALVRRLFRPFAIPQPGAHEATPESGEGRASVQESPPQQATEGAPAQPGEPSATPMQFEVESTFNVRSVTQQGGNTIAEVEVALGRGLEQLNAAAAANGGTAMPERALIRVTLNAEGGLVAAEGMSGETTAVAETLARQAIASVPRGAQALESTAAAAAGAARISPWVRGASWVGALLFVGITAYQYETAPPEQRPRVLVTAGGSLAGGFATSYLICNVAFGIETVGWSLLLCGLFAGAPGAYVGAEVSGAAYDAATATPLQRALHGMQSEPRNVQRLFSAMVEQSTSARGGLPITPEFIEEFIASVPANLADDELSTLTAQLRPTVSSDTLQGILRSLRRAIDDLPRRRPVVLPPILDITERGGLGFPDTFRLDSPGGGRIRLLPPPRPPRFGDPFGGQAPGTQTVPLLEIQL